VRVLITGAAGFAGSHLAELALAEGAEVYGGVLPGATPNLAGLPAVHQVPGDLTEPGAAAGVVEAARPDRVFHLAGASVVGTSWAQRAAVIRNNLDGTLRLLEALRDRPAPCLVVSSADVYGLVPPDAQPIGEDRPVAPVSPYGLSKACVELAVVYHVRVDRLPLVLARPFNHVGPRQGPGFVCSDIARQVAAIEIGRQPPVLEIGAVSTRRDFTDVRDVVRAYWLLLQRGQPGQAYNVASGRVRAIQEVLDGFLGLAGRPIEVRPAADRLRPIDIPLLTGDAGRLRAVTGWAPAIPFERTLADVLDDWRARLAREGP
jgi:GDP-4-dehydro-6-deoxy-D-mannose reductase